MNSDINAVAKESQHIRNCKETYNLRWHHSPHLRTADTIKKCFKSCGMAVNVETNDETPIDLDPTVCDMPWEQFEAMGG